MSRQISFSKSGVQVYTKYSMYKLTTAKYGGTIFYIIISIAYVALKTKINRL